MTRCREKKGEKRKIAQERERDWRHQRQTRTNESDEGKEGKKTGESESQREREKGKACKDNREQKQSLFFIPTSEYLLCRSLFCIRIKNTHFHEPVLCPKSVITSAIIMSSC